MKKLILCIVIGFFYTSFHVNAQGCAVATRNPWQWPSHRNWVVATNLFTGSMVNTQAGTATDIGDAFNPVSAYEGCATISSDQGNLLFFSTGRLIQRPNATTIYAGLLQGNENGSVGNRGSASQGIIAIKHPLTPDRYYFLTTDDALSGTLGLNYAVIGANGTMMQNSTRLGNYRTTEGISATFHANGIDIWVSVCESGSNRIHAYLITCAGISATPVTSAVGISAILDEERGGLAFSWDGTKLASGFGNTAGTDRVRIYNFNKTTGALTYSNSIGTPLANNGEFAYDLTFSPDNSRVLVSTNQGAVYSLNATNGTGNIVSTAAGSHSAIEIGGDGNLYRATLGSPLQRLTGNLNNGGALGAANINGTSCSRGLNTMFLPPTEEPDIQEAGPYCNTDPTVNLSTTWVCSGLDAEDATNYPSAYSGPGITNAATGQFAPATAGVGTHRIIFKRCSVDDTIFITVTNCQTCPDTTLKNGGPICVGGTVNLNTMKITTAAGTWSITAGPGTNPATINANTFTTTTTTTAGNYTVRYTLNPDPGGTCPKFSERVIRVNPLPTVTLSDQSSCPNGSAIFNAGNFASYVWSGPNGYTSTQNPITVTNAGTYAVTVTDVNSCTGSDNANYTISTQINVTIPNQTICADENATFNAGTFSAYNWTGPNAFSSTQNPITTSNAGTYNISVTDANGCIGTGSATLTVNTPPTVILADQSSCPNGSATFNAGNFAAYAWSGPNGYTSTQNPITVTNAGIYSVNVTDANGCIGNGSADYTISTQLTANIPNQTICADTNAIFNAGTFSTYNWTGPNGYTNTQNSITVTDAGTYSVALTDANGCSGTASTTLTVNALPLPNIDDAEICEGESYTFDAGTFSSYTWSSGEVSQSITPSQTATYTVVVTDVKGCKNSDVAVLTVNPNPQVDLGNDYEGCEGTSTTFDAGNIGATYLWSNNENTQSIIVSTGGIYAVVVTDTKGCTGSGSVYADFIAVPQVELGNDVDLCEGESTVISATINPSNSILKWNIPQNALSFTISTTQKIIATVSNGDACIGEDSIQVTVHPIPRINAMKDTTLCFIENSNGLLLDAGGGAVFYNWSNGSSQQSINVSSEGTYSVWISSNYGCASSDTVVVSEDCPSSLFTPNSFTPNDDGVNDVFYVKGENIYDFEIWIFNRWGEMIYHSTDMNEGWNGKKFNTLRDAEIDVYVWKVNYKYWSDWKNKGEDRKDVGKVTIIR